VMSMTKIKYHSTVLLISLRLSKVESYIFVASLRGVKGDILEAEKGLSIINIRSFAWDGKFSSA